MSLVNFNRIKIFVIIICEQVSNKTVIVPMKCSLLASTHMDGRVIELVSVALASGTTGPRTGIHSALSTSSISYLYCQSQLKKCQQEESGIYTLCIFHS